MLLRLKTITISAALSEGMCKLLSFFSSVLWQKQALKITAFPTSQDTASDKMRSTI